MCETEVEMSECGAGAFDVKEDLMRGTNAEGDLAQSRISQDAKSASKNVS
jgi:hypothetical protein